ncbi:MAG: PHP domain-containing protein [Dehalococcoidales bacterium]|nr:MAG: PHP domain-containing protein [Dehalococcoidales bacterium]
MLSVNLHLHSNASDGRFSPAELIRRAVGEGLTVIALTDHDTIDGISPALEAARAFPGLRLIPGVEISTDVPEGEVHILGYFIDYIDGNLQAALKQMHNSRWERAQKMVTKLEELGCPIEWERVQEIAGEGAIGRPHVAQAMLERGYIESFKEAFTKYIGRDGPAYVEREKVTPAESVELVIQAKGLPVLAHPLTLPEPERMVTELKAAGLVGIEAYYAGYATEDIDRLVSIANRHNLITTGGTDFHGLDNNSEVSIGGVDIPDESLKDLLALARQTRLKPASP